MAEAIAAAMIARFRLEAELRAMGRYAGRAVHFLGLAEVETARGEKDGEGQEKL